MSLVLCFSIFAIMCTTQMTKLRFFVLYTCHGKFRIKTFLKLPMTLLYKFYTICHVTNMIYSAFCHVTIYVYHVFNTFLCLLCDYYKCPNNLLMIYRTFSIKVVCTMAEFNSACFVEKYHGNFSWVCFCIYCTMANLLYIPWQTY